MAEKCEMRITENGKTRNYIQGAQEYLESCGVEGEITLIAKGRTINKLVTIVGVIRKSFPELEQQNNISWEEIHHANRVSNDARVDNEEVVEDRQSENKGEDNNYDSYDDYNDNAEKKKEKDSKKYKSLMRIVLRKRTQEQEITCS